MDDSNRTKIGLKTDLLLRDLIRGRVIHLYDGLLFVRTEGNELFPEDALLSKRHLKISLKGNSVFVEDLASTNKTRVNGKVIPPNPGSNGSKPPLPPEGATQ